MNVSRMRLGENNPHPATGSVDIDTARVNLRMACALRGLSPSEVSRRAGMARNGLTQFIAGRTILSYANTLKVCRVLGLPIGMLHIADSVTQNRIRIFHALERMPDYKLAAALRAVETQDH